MALRLSLQNLAHGDPVILQLALFSSSAYGQMDTYTDMRLPRQSPLLPLAERAVMRKKSAAGRGRVGYTLEQAAAFRDRDLGA